MEKNRRAILFGLAIAAAAFLVFANSIDGEFVYDDRRQIVANPLIQELSLYGKALATDVWAFKGDGTISASNYWRPTFTAWCILNFRLFGLEPFGWHLSNVVLHVIVCLLAFALILKLGIDDLVAFCIVLLFAVHPVHTESVAWISGSPDLLFTAFLLGSLLIAVASRRANGKLYLGLSLLFYGLSLGAKEIAVLCIPLFAFVLSSDNKEEDSKGLVLRDLRGAVPFAIVAVAYLLVRFLVLGSVAQAAEDSASLFSSVLTAPMIFLFYLRQSVFPYWLGPNYGVRPVESLEFLNFVVPLLTVIALFTLGWLAPRLSYLRMFAIAIFILPLIAVFNVTAFPSEQIVHDRYLYLPLLGMLVFLFSFIPSTNSASKLLIVTWALAILFGFQTVRYNNVWKSDLSLWRHSVSIDPNSSFSWLQLGSALTEKGQIDEAIVAQNKSLSIRPSALALVGRARNQIAKRESNAAIDGLKQVLNYPSESINAYTLFQAYEAFAVALQDLNRLADAEASLREARRRLPIYRAALTEKLAVILYLQNRKPEALTELNSVRDQARLEMLPSSKFVFLRLGMLNAETGKIAEAKRDLLEFLERTKLSTDPNIVNDRKLASTLIEKLGR